MRRREGVEGTEGDEGHDTKASKCKEGVEAMRTKRCFGVLLLAAMVWWPAGAGAILVVPVTFEQLVDESTAVVFGRVADVRGQWTADRQFIDSIITVDALDYIKGDLGAHVVMRLPGGEAGGVINLVPGAPTLREGEMVVLFLKARGPALLTTVGLGQGIFRVTHDHRTGAMLVTPPSLKDSATGRMLRDAAGRRALRLESLAATVRATEQGR